MTNTVPLIHLVRHRQLKFLGHILRMSKEEPARRYALYIPTIGKRRPGRPRTSYLNYVQRLLGDNEGAMQEQQIAAFADDRRAWRNLVVACSAADGWWWWWILKLRLWHYINMYMSITSSILLNSSKVTFIIMIMSCVNNPWWSLSKFFRGPYSSPSSSLGFKGNVSLRYLDSGKDNWKL